MIRCDLPPRWVVSATWNLFFFWETPCPTLAAAVNLFLFLVWHSPGSFNSLCVCVHCLNSLTAKGRGTVSVSLECLHSCLANQVVMFPCKLFDQMTDQTSTLYLFSMWPSCADHIAWKWQMVSCIEDHISCTSTVKDTLVPDRISSSSLY